MATLDRFLLPATILRANRRLEIVPCIRREPNNLYLYLLALFNERGVLNVANTIDKFHGGGEDLRIVGQLVRTLVRGKLEN